MARVHTSALTPEVRARRFLTRFFVQCHPKTELGSFSQENVDSADVHRDQSLCLS